MSARSRAGGIRPKKSGVGHWSSFGRGSAQFSVKDRIIAGPGKGLISTWDAQAFEASEPGGPSPELPLGTPGVSGLGAEPHWDSWSPDGDKAANCRRQWASRDAAAGP